MQAGRLKYVVKVLEKKAHRDKYGAEVQGYGVNSTLPADIKFKSGSKTIEDMAVVNSQYLEINIRYKKGIDETFIISWNGRFYRILFINEIEYKKVLQIVAERITDLTLKINLLTVDDTTINIDDSAITADKVTK